VLKIILAQALANGVALLAERLRLLLRSKPWFTPKVSNRTNSRKRAQTDRKTDRQTGGGDAVENKQVGKTWILSCFSFVVVIETGIGVKKLVAPCSGKKDRPSDPFSSS
jgi:hypothetical protein